MQEFTAFSATVTPDMLVLQHFRAQKTKRDKTAFGKIEAENQCCLGDAKKPKFLGKNKARMLVFAAFCRRKRGFKNKNSFENDMFICVSAHVQKSL